MKTRSRPWPRAISITLTTMGAALGGANVATGSGGVIHSCVNKRLKAAIEAVLLGSSWQRRRVRSWRNVLAKVPKVSGRWWPRRSARLAQRDAGPVAEQLDSIAAKLGRQFRAVEEMLREAATDVCAFAAFPQAHWKKIWSRNG